MDHTHPTPLPVLCQAILAARRSWGQAQMPVTQKVTGGVRVRGSSWARSKPHLSGQSYSWSGQSLWVGFADLGIVLQGW